MCWRSSKAARSDHKDLVIQALAQSERVSDLPARHGVSRKLVCQQAHMTARMRSMLFWASVALPFQMRQCRRSTSSTITTLAAPRAGSSAGRPVAICFKG